MTPHPYRARVVTCIALIVVVAALWGQYGMWQRYARGHDADPGPHYCVIGSMFPFDYPIAGDTEAGPSGRPCPPPHGPPTGVYLRWKDGRWTSYGLQGAP